jgi:aspartate racemase
MRTLGIIGGMSWESTAQYYALINRGVRDRLGGLHSAPLIISSCDFAPVEKLQSAGKWDELGEVLKDTARRLEAAGAEGLLIATNTMHDMADEVAACASIPLLHIADALGEVLSGDGLKTVGLLGTRFTMERPFYVERLSSRFGIRVRIPDEKDRETVHRVIYEELCLGIMDDTSKDAYVSIMEKLVNDGAQAVVLACTEIGLLISGKDINLPLYDTTLIHAKVAVRWITGKNSV